jgi:hypothetical protein
MGCHDAHHTGGCFYPSWDGAGFMEIRETACTIRVVHPYALPAVVASRDDSGVRGGQRHRGSKDHNRIESHIRRTAAPEVEDQKILPASELKGQALLDLTLLGILYILHSTGLSGYE